ncbi:hypothetical protein AVEN_28227-1 [Araneus ventricosus]|uniref:Uncharacterized protein n=1 Tax=Araneus ventricosus TaxID=182803 RepID=A0A4Y2QLU4_ARAVE|nr:hypothetical protein AVEN_28227-1 [Araneus ventricosus]
MLIGVRVTSNDHRPRPDPSRRRYVLSQERGKTPLLYPPGKRDPAYLYGDFSFVNSWCLPGKSRVTVNHPALAYGALNDSRCNSSRTEVGALVVRHGSGRGLTLPEGGTYYHWWEVTQSPHYYTPRESEFLFIYTAKTHIRVLAMYRACN